MIRALIEERFRLAWCQSRTDKRVETSDDLVLLDSGVDSLEFAMLVVQLEQELGYDPFVFSAEVVYPRTFGELVALYERFGTANKCQ
jgi:hypothetical protein